MSIIEAGDTVLVISKTLLSANQKTDIAFSMERSATYVFRKDSDNIWRCIMNVAAGLRDDS
jgi:ketosteroid isomerase-like protein